MAVRGTVIGLDLSLTAPGLAAIPVGWDPGAWRDVGTFALNTKPFRELPRPGAIAETARAIDCWVSTFPAPQHVFIEGYGFLTAGRLAYLGELGGAVRADLWRSKTATLYTDVPALRARSFLLGGKLKVKGSKQSTHAALKAAGAPRAWSGDVLDAFVVANFGLTELGLLGLTLRKQHKLECDLDEDCSC